MSDPIPFLQSVWNLTNPRPAVQINRMVVSGTTMRERFDDPHRMAQHWCREVSEHQGIPDDYVPIVSTYLGTGVFPSAFGCPVEWFEDKDPWAVALVTSDPSVALDLPQPSVTDGLLGRVLDLTRYAATVPAACPPPSGPAPAPVRIRVTDVQGPFDIAYLVWHSQDFMLALYDRPDAAHALMRKCTRLLIEFVQTQRRLVKSLGAEFVPCHFPAIWMPDGAGISVSDDCAALLSPRQYAEFVLPYLNEVSDALGGVFVHSCGNFTHNLGNLAQVRNLRGIDFAVGEQPLEPIAARFAGRCVLSVRLGLDKDRHYAGIPEWIEHVVRTTPTVQGLYLTVNTWYSSPESGRPWSDSDLVRILDLVHPS